jgi:hypothetical protein
MPAETSSASISPIYKSETRIDIALLASALFLQRFTLPFGNTFVHLELVAIGFILLYQFLSGKLLIQYDRLLWFLALGLVTTCSLLLNFNSTLMTSYSLFMIFYSLFTLNRPSTPYQYKKTLQAFQFLVIILSCLGVVQFLAQFVVNGTELIYFYGIVPDVLFSDPAVGMYDHPRTFANGIIKSNGLFLAEPSILSQITALGILIETLEFRRPRYLIVIAFGFLSAYSGTGSMLLLIFLPLAGVRQSRAGLSALFVVMLILGLFETGIFDLSVFTSRVSEFNDPGSSGFQRFVSPLLLAGKHFDDASLQALLVGSGPGMAKTFGDAWFGGGSMMNWFKLFYENGIIGLFIFGCFLASCFRRSRCPGVVVAAIIFAYFFLEGLMTITIALCTLNGPEHRYRRSDEASRYSPSSVTGSAPV